MPHSLLITLEYPSFARLQRASAVAKASADKSDGTATTTYGGVANYYAGVVKYWPYGTLQVLHVHLGRFWPRWLSIFFEVRSKINNQKSRIDLLQVGHVLPLGYVALLVKWFKGIPYLVYTHGMDITVPARSLWKRTMLKMILRNAKFVVAASEFTKGEIVKLGIDTTKIIIVYPCPSVSCGKDERGISPKNKTAETLRAGCPAKRDEQSRAIKTGEQLGEPSLVVRGDMPSIILTVSRLVPRKGIDTVLAALPEVIKRVPNVQYVVIGTGPELNFYKLQTCPPVAYARPPGLRPGEVGRAPGVGRRATSYHPTGDHPKGDKLGDHVKFLGAVSDEEKIAWYKKARIFVLVPRPLGGDVEGFGTVYLEANSFGLPVVASRTGGVPEAVLHGVNGLLVAPNNPQETAQALIQLLTDKPLADTLGRQGQARIHKEFTWGTQLQKFSRFF